MMDEQEKLRQLEDYMADSDKKWRGLPTFIRESNQIEGEDTDGERLEREVPAYGEFLHLPELAVSDLVKFVSVVKPGNRLRVAAGMDVRVGDHVAPFGGPEIVAHLMGLLSAINGRKLTAYAAHHEYETLHPFTDGNGRSGRVVWLWMHKNQTRGGAYERAIIRGFLLQWYYESLHFGRNP